MLFGIHPQAIGDYLKPQSQLGEHATIP